MSRDIGSLAIGMMAFLLAVLPVATELQNVEVGGEFKVRGRYFSNVSLPGSAGPFAVPGLRLRSRAIGQAGGIGWGPSWDSRGGDVSFIEQRNAPEREGGFYGQRQRVYRIGKL